MILESHICLPRKTNPATAGIPLRGAHI
jgi:hypothetical protein